MSARAFIRVVIALAIAWTSLLSGLMASVKFSDPGPPATWRHEFDVPAIVEGNRAWCPLDDTTIVEPGGTFCTGEGWDPE